MAVDAGAGVGIVADGEDGMRRMVAGWALALGLAAAGAAGAQEGAGPEGLDRAGIEAVIRDQLGDFAARDVPGAWAHASPLIQGMFGSAEAFGAMVERGYPMVWDNRDARFGALREERGGLWQGVTVADPEGRLWVLDYEMVEVDGAWRIAGVVVRPAPELAA